MWLSRSRRSKSPTTEHRYQAAPYVLAGRRGDETYLLNKHAGKYYRLDDVSSELWAMLHQPLAMPDILQKLGAIYEMPPRELADDVSTLITTLLGYGVITCDA